jgi:hypothetical protein
VPPEKAEDATIYGNWGGYNPVDAVPDPNQQNAYVPQDPENAWPQQMRSDRVGIFHYVMGYQSPGGSCGEGIACGFDMFDPLNSAHEFGHTLGLDHNGPYGLDEPNCKPNYPSLMNYAYLDSGYQQFSDGRNFPDFNNHSLRETAAIDPSNQPLVSALEANFSYKVDHATGSVDWNRDGVFAAANAPVRAYANYRPGGEGCEFTREGRTDTGIKSERSPAIVRFNNTIWVFAVDLNGALVFTYAEPEWNCSSSNVDACPIAQFKSAETHDLGPLDAIDAKTMVINGNEYVILVGIRPDGSLLETRLFMQAGVQVWDSVVSIDGYAAAGSEPSLASNFDKSRLALAYKGRNNVVRLRFRSAQGWSAEQMLMVGASPLVAHPSSSPALTYAALPLGIVAGEHEHLIGAFTDRDGDIQLYTPQFPGNRWGRIAMPYDSMYSAPTFWRGKRRVWGPQVGRPVMAWTGGPPQDHLGEAANAAIVQPTTYGRLYILYLQYNAAAPIYHSPTNPIRMAMSYVDKTGTLRIGLNSYFDNVSQFAYGMSLLTPTDGTLRGAFTSAVLPNKAINPEDKIYFRPHADGISDLVYHNYDDWKTLAHGACAELVQYQADSPVKCAAPW